MDKIERENLKNKCEDRIEKVIEEFDEISNDIDRMTDKSDIGELIQSTRHKLETLKRKIKQI